MAIKPIDLTGQRFGKLVVTGVRLPPEPGKKKQWKWECVCDCGNKTRASGSHLMHGDVQSCGCASSRKTVGVRSKKASQARTAEEYLASNSEHQPDGCIYWTGAIGNRGYGVCCLHKKIGAAHRLAYQTFVGPIPDGLFVCHTCDVRHCINPKHLFVGTQDDNMKDKVKKVRHSHGEVHGMAKLTEEQARLALESHAPNSTLAELFGVTRDHVAAIRNGKVWKHLRGAQ